MNELAVFAQGPGRLTGIATAESKSKLSTVTDAMKKMPVDLIDLAFPPRRFIC